MQVWYDSGMRKPRIGDVVRVEFWDHCEGGSQLLRCCVYGECRGFYDDRILVCGWSGMGCEDDETVWVIARGLVEGIRILK